MEKIENPKVFISYAWGSEEYQQKVLDFARSLKRDGVDVLLDKWNNIGGNDLNDFMEKCVKDKTVTNVIILLDELYTKKADNRSGGVGTETQIISEEVYKSTEQSKFIPVIFERDVDGNIHKPIYLRGRMHYDLSDEEIYETEYKKLVKHLYGRESYYEPEKGPTPKWIDDEIILSPKKHSAFTSLKANLPAAIKNEKFNDYLSDITNSIVDYAKSFSEILELPGEYLNAYDSSKQLRTDYLNLINHYSYIDNGIRLIGDFLEESFSKVFNLNEFGKEFGLARLYELFLYTIAVLLHKKDFSSTAYILGKTYFVPRFEPITRSFDMFRGGRSRNFDIAVNERDGKNYYSGLANYWIEDIDTSFCSKKDFLTADQLCTNYSIYGNDYIGKHPWFPITYTFDDYYENATKGMASRLFSKEGLKEILVLMNYDSAEAFKKKYAEVDTKIRQGDFQNFQYSLSMWSVPIFGYYVSTEQIGTVR